MPQHCGQEFAAINLLKWTHKVNVVSPSTVMKTTRNEWTESRADAGSEALAMDEVMTLGNVQV